MLQALQAFVDYVANISLVELGALVFGILYVLLAAKENILCWPAGIVASVLALVLAVKSDYRLDVLKESYYILMGFYGLYAWTHGKSVDNKRMIVSYSAAQVSAILVAGGLLSTAVGFAFDKIGSSLPYLDAATTIFALITTWMVTQKVIQNWLFWIVINAAGIYMYFRNEFYAFSVLLGIYLVLSFFGYYEWRRLFNIQSNELAERLS